jgi:transforming growth factor-beta-induced protein
MEKSQGLPKAAAVLVVLVLALAAIGLAACGDDETAAAESPAPAGDASMDLVAVAAENPELSMFVEAVQANGLAEALAGEGPFTVFAPDNAAIEASGVDVTEDVLLVHVVEGEKLMAADLAPGAKYSSMLEGNDLTTYTGKDGNVYMKTFVVTTPDIEASNGVIHIIDGVNEPKE